MEKKISWPGWDIVGVLGRGGFGEVYKIRREVVDDEEFAALKVISIPKDESEVENLEIEGLDKESITLTFRDQVKDIIREYKIMRDMRDVPNIVHCDDVRCVQKADGYGWDIYIQMELLTPLKKCLTQLQNEAEIIRLGIDICKALVACQEQSIIHRDIKPENIFVSDKGKYKLGDFGIARSVEHTTVMTMAGSYPFMAPEVPSNKYDKTVDIYSLGLVLYWLLNERRGPFVPERPTYSQKREAEARRFAGERIPEPKYGSEALKTVVLKACAFDPKQRYLSAAAMLDALRALERGEPAQAEEAIDETVVVKPVIQQDNDRTVLVRPVANETVLDRDKNPKEEEQKSWQEREQEKMEALRKKRAEQNRKDKNEKNWHLREQEQMEALRRKRREQEQLRKEEEAAERLRQEEDAQRRQRQAEETQHRQRQAEALRKEREAAELRRQKQEEEQKTKKKMHPLLRVAAVLLLLISVVILGVVLSKNEIRNRNNYENPPVISDENPPVISDEKNSVVEEAAPAMNVSGSELGEFVAGYRRASTRETPVIAFVAPVVGQAWWDYAKTGVEEWEKETGIDVIYEGPSKFNVDMQNQIMENLINQGVDILCVEPADYASSEDVWAKAREKGVIVITTEVINGGYDVEPFSDADMGVCLMDQLAAQMGYEGQYITMVGSMTMESHNNWADAAVAHQQETYPKMSLVPDARVSCEGYSEIAYDLTKEIIQKYPDLKGILGTSSSAAPGAARAIEELGLSGEVFAVSVAVPSEVRDYLKSGVLQATVLWDPAAQVQAMLNLSVAFYYEGSIYSGMDLGVDGYESVRIDGNVYWGNACLPITAENVDKFTF